MQPTQAQNAQASGGGVQGLGYSVLSLGNNVLGWSFTPPPLLPYYWTPGPFLPGMTPLLFGTNNSK